MTYETETEVKYEMIKRLFPLYDHHALPLLFRPFRSLIHPTPVYRKPNLDNYVHPAIETFSES